MEIRRFRTMGELAERLRTAREAKELSLEQVAEATRIPLNYLEALEDEDLGVFTSDVHARGFLRNYALYLDLDPDEAAELYDTVGGTPRSRSKAAPTPLAEGQRTRLSTIGADVLLGLVVVALVALAAFSVYQRQNPVAVIPTAGPPPTPTATPMPVFEGTSYTMDVALDYAEKVVAVRQRIDYTNATSETLPNLMLNVHANHNRGTFELNEIKLDMDDELVQPEVFPLDVTLRVELPRPLKPNEHVALFLDYTLDLPKISPDAEFVKASFGYSQRAMSLGNWYPVMAPWREEKGWYGQTYFEIGDPYVTEVADYSVSITTTEDVVIAGTGREVHADGQWQFEAEQVRAFAFAASDVYQVSSAQVGDVAVHSYYFPVHEEAGQVALETAVQSMELFAELYGTYPFSDYRVAETEFSGGLEFTGMTFLGSVFYDQYDGTTRTPLIPLTAHEVSHQWFYSLVGNDQVVEPWLDEAAAEYSGYLYYERFLPEDVDWWWFYAVDQWAPTGKIDSIIYLFRSNREYMDAVYRRGAQFMRDLRETMGDPAFQGFLVEYLRRNSHRLAKSRDFFTVVQEYTTADLVPLQEEYFRQRVLP
jgi:transcriptional regulator with XRE-family HTH domain